LMDVLFIVSINSSAKFMVCEGYFDQRKECDSGRILKTTYFKLTNCSSIFGIKLSFFSRREARHGNAYALVCTTQFHLQRSLSNKSMTGELGPSTEIFKSFNS